MTRLKMRWWGLMAGWLVLGSIGGCPEPAADDQDSDGDGIVDGIDTDADGDGITDPIIDPTDTPPFAAISVSPSAVAAPGDVITLDASGSTDPDADPLTFEWVQTAGAEAAFSSKVEKTVTITAPFAPENVELKFSVTVRDGRGGEASAETSIFLVVSGEFGGNAQSAAAYRDTLTPDEAYHLLRRAALGARPDEVSLAVARGLTATVDDLLSFKPIPAEITLLAESFEDDMPKRWLVNLIEGPNPLHERMAMFWHDRFATSRRVLDGRDANLAVLHWGMLHTYALGNYREFLKALTLDPLELIWLDGANSPKQKPNENYAREFWELFTLGRDTLYTEADIRESSRAFTGITLLRQGNLDARPIYDLLNHDETSKTIFPGRAQPANFNFEGVIDLTLAQPEAAQYVARNLFAFFVHDHPTPEVVEDLAASFRASGWNIAALVRRILLSQAMFSAEARGNQISSPVEHAVGVARTLAMHMHSEDSQGFVLDQLSDDLTNSGQELMNPPGVEGWREDKGWLQDQWIISRVRALGRTMEYGPDRRSRLPYHLLPPETSWAQREVRGQMVDAMAQVFHLKLSEEERMEYIEVLDQNGYLAFHLEQARNQAQHVFEMIRLMAMDERVIGR